MRNGFKVAFFFFLLAQGFHNSFGFRSLNMGFSRLIFIENCSHQSSLTTIIYLFYVCSFHLLQYIFFLYVEPYQIILAVFILFWAFK
jgi:hypothetical protein